MVQQMREAHLLYHPSPLLRGEAARRRPGAEERAENQRHSWLKYTRLIVSSLLKCCVELPEANSPIKKRVQDLFNRIQNYYQISLSQKGI